MKTNHHLYMFVLGITILTHTQSSDDNDIDRLNRKYTVCGLIILAIVSGFIFNK